MQKGYAKVLILKVPISPKTLALIPMSAKEAINLTKADEYSLVDDALFEDILVANNIFKKEEGLMFHVAIGSYILSDGQNDLMLTGMLEFARSLPAYQQAKYNLISNHN